MITPSAEWLEADGLGGFAFGRADGIRTRRYHAVLAVATTPPTGRIVLVNGFDAWVETPDGRFALSSQRYAPDVTHPDGAARITSFTRDPWPTWTYVLPNGLEIIHELVSVRGAPLVALSWRLNRPEEARLVVQPFLSGRDVHATHHENTVFRFDARVAGRRVTWQPYGDLPPVIALANGDYFGEPSWYRQFQYDEERARGLDFIEDLGSPGRFTVSLDRRAVLAFGAAGTRSSRASGADARRFRHGFTARPTTTSWRAGAARRSSQATRGSPTGVATRSSRFAASASRARAHRVSPMRERSCWSGPST